MPSTLALTAYQFGGLLAKVTLALLLVLLVRRYLQRRRTSDLVAALVVAVLLVGGLVRDAGDDGASAAAGGSAGWSTSYARDVHAGFLDGCARSTNGAVDCRCAFASLTSRPAYSTPEGFTALAEEAQATQRLPAAVIESYEACRT